MGAVAVIVPVALLLVGGVAAAAGAQKKKQTAAAAGTGETTPSTPAGGAATTPAASATPPSILPGAATTPVATVTGVPADVQALVIAAITSQNPVTMRRAADQLEAKYPLQAADLRKTAATFEAAMAAAQGTTAATTAAQAASAAANVPGTPVAVPTTTNVPTVATTTLPPLSSMPTPTTTAAPAAADPNRVRAAALVVALKTAKKGTASEPRAQVKEFQLIERLSRTDGSYGSETALALADKYGIVPPKPLFWGKKGGSHATLVADKNAYSAHLLNLATKDPQRADEWRSAAKV